GISVSSRVRDDVKNQPGLNLNSLGKQNLKNVDEPMEVFAISEIGDDPPVNIPRYEGIFRKRLAFAVLAVIIIFSGFYVYKTVSDKSATLEGISSERDSMASIAVLPFENMSSDPENEYFSDGMTEEIINALTKINGLRVASRTSSFRFKGEKIDIREVGEKLNVKTILEGSVRKSGSKLRITAQLINIEDGYHIWSEIFEREMSDVFAIQDEISQSIANRLKIEFVGKDEFSVAERHTENLAAYNLYLKGRFYSNKATKEGLKKGIEYLNLALDKDPLYALAYSELSKSYAAVGYFNHDLLPRREAFLKATVAAKKALEIDDNLAEAHTALAYVKRTHDWDWKGAEQEFKRAIELDANDSNAHEFYALYLAAVGRLDEAIKEAKIALELDPVSLNVNQTAARIFYYSRRYDRAVDQANILLDMDPNFTSAYAVLANVYEQKGKYEQAIDHYVLSGSLAGSNVEAFWESHQTFAVSSWTDYWQDVLEWVDSYPDPDRISSIIRAVLYTRLGQKDKAFEQLELAYEKREGKLVYIKVDPKFDSLRSDPRFSELLKKMGLEH
ncbi:MAG: tetratricopeptide repeat protein, partial [Candidatus Marinimicrobia bacterium]|nr:tetratricopeptide repeat protein [Candidatus Neomarinimicrobiota bacterium]